jgi:hypothetical protein
MIGAGAILLVFVAVGFVMGVLGLDTDVLVILGVAIPITITILLLIREALSRSPNE